MRSLISLFLVASLFTLNVVAKSVTRLDLQVGATELLSVTAITDILVADEALVDSVLLSDTSLAIKAKASGYTELILRKEDGQIERIAVHITGIEAAAERAQLDWLRKHMPELTITETEGLVVIAGTLSKSQESLLQKHAQRHPHWLLQISEPAVRLEQMIELQVTILEVKRHVVEQLGVQWPTAINGPLLSNSASQWVTMPVAIQSSINLLQQSGQAKILAEPKLSAVSGGEAEFLVGGEFPVPQVLAQGQQDVTFKEYGIALKMSPIDLGAGQISTAIAAEISTLDPALAVNGVPGMLTRKVSSMITAQSGESMILSGLISHEQSQQAEHFPFLNQLPILGSLFRSEQFRQAETDLLVVVTPEFKSQVNQRSDRVAAAQQAVLSFRNQSNCTGLIDEL